MLYYLTMRYAYPEQRRRFWLVIMFTLLVVALASAIIVAAELSTQEAKQTEAVISYGQSAQDDISVNTSVSTTQLNISLFPDARVPATGNYANSQEVQIRTCNTALTPLYTISSLSTNSSGAGTINLAASSNFSGNYNVYVRGISHLGKNMGCVNLNQKVTSVSFSAASERLVPGETSTAFDNYINGLDGAAIAGNFSTSNTKYDLNRDGTVDQADLDIWGDNVYQAGDD